MNHLDLFSGIGGFSLAARWAGIETIAFCERDKFCQQVLKKHWPDVPIYTDIKDFNGLMYRGKVDILTAGFPCQPFSVAGKQKGINDDRYLWPDTMRIIERTQPAWCILENVPGIIPHLDPILEDLEKEGYSWQAFLIPASAVHAPHKRERLWIVAYRDRERFDIRGYNWKERHVQIDCESHVAALQSEWTQFQPESWATFNTQEWLGFTADTAGERPQREGSSGQSLHSETNTERQATNAFDDSINTISKPSSQTNSSLSAERSERHTDTSEHWTDSAIFHWQEDQPPIPGVDVRLPNGLDRNKSLGNSIVPQIPYLFMKMILCIENETHTSNPCMV